VAFQFTDGIKDSVVEFLFPDFIPEMFYRIHLGAVCRLPDELDVFRDVQAPGSVPSGTVHEYDHVEFGEFLETSWRKIFIMFVFV